MLEMWIRIIACGPARERVNALAMTNSSAPRVTSGITSWPALTSNRVSSHAL